MLVMAITVTIVTVDFVVLPEVTKSQEEIWQPERRPEAPSGILRIWELNMLGKPTELSGVSFKDTL